MERGAQMYQGFEQELARERVAQIRTEVEHNRLEAQDGDGRDEHYGGWGYDVCYIDEGDYTQGCQEVALAIE
jgi:hypothetical protein